MKSIKTVLASCLFFSTHAMSTYAIAPQVAATTVKIIKKYKFVGPATLFASGILVGASATYAWPKYQTEFDAMKKKHLDPIKTSIINIRRSYGWYTYKDVEQMLTAEPEITAKVVKHIAKVEDLLKGGCHLPETESYVRIAYLNNLFADSKNSQKRGAEITKEANSDNKIVTAKILDKKFDVETADIPAEEETNQGGSDNDRRD